jgi:hypothetical protein
VDRIDFANDSPTSSSVRGPLAFTQSYSDSVGNANFGWMLGGASDAGNITSQINRIDFANDTSTGSERGRLTIARGNAGAAASNNYAWIAAGGSFANVARYSSVDRIDLANDSPSTASPRGFLPQSISNVSGLSNQFYGWFAGGTITPGSPASSSSVHRIDFANDSPTAASARGPLSGTRYASASLSNTAYGWIAGGIILPFAAHSTVDRIDFANDSPTAASARGPLSSPLFECAGANNQFLGWVMGGGNFAATSLVQRIDFSNDLAAVSIRGNVAENKYGHGGTSNYVKTTPIFNVTQYSKGAGVVGTTGLANFGWFTGGLTPVSSVINVIDRIDFSNDTAAASPRGPMTENRSEHAAAGNANYGWIVGNLFTNTAINRIDFSNDSPTSNSRRGNSNLTRVGLAGTSNSSYGWFAGGVTSGPVRRTNVERIDFSNDNVGAGSRGLLLQARTNMGAAGNAYYGWYVGGSVFGPSARSTVERIDFSNDSPTSASFRGSLLASRAQIAGTSNANYGWFGFGTGGTNIDRIDFSSDLVAASVRGPHAGLRFHAGASGNASFGWFGGGDAPLGGRRSLVERIDYSNDSPAAASPRGNLSEPRTQIASVSNYVK